jgi:serine/threonine protein kinase
MKGRQKRIEILQSLGQGPRGDLARARAEGVSRDCALKTFFPDVWSGKKDRHRFIEDSEVLSAISSPYIAEVLDIGERGSELYLLREMVDGIPLDLVFFHQVEMPAKAILGIAQNIGHALREAHRMGITHGNLRPSNVILQPNGKLKVTDFGLPPPSRVGQEVGGAVAELTAYLSPEQLVGGASVDERTDLFSLGVILYNLATLDRPFWGKDSAEIRNAILGVIPKPFEEGEEPDPKLQLIILKCLQKNVEDRYQSISSVERDIRSSSGPKPEPITRELFQGIAVRCGLEKVFPAPIDVPPELLEDKKRPATTVSIETARPEAETKPVEAPPEIPEKEETAPPSEEKVSEEEEAVAEPETVAEETPPPEVEEKAPPVQEAVPSAPTYELSRRVARRPRSPEEVIQRYIRAWNTRAFLVEYSCFDKDFIRTSRREYMDRRLGTYLKLTRQGQVTQALEKMLRVERRGEEATVLCARRLEFPRRTEMFLDFYTLREREGDWKITDVRSRRTTKEEIARVVDHELTFLEKESTG